MDEVKKKKEIKEINSENQNHLFFHDCINQTHGIVLFLSNKSSLGPSEIDSLKSEVKLLQALVQNHFNLNHKNLEPFEVDENQTQKIQSALEKLIALYYPSEDKKIAMELKGEEVGFLDFISLYRILNNIVKNMAEAKVAGGQFLLEFSDHGLNITTQNKMPDKNASGAYEGLGLQSIASLAQEAGGRYHYEIHNDTWVNLVFLPYQNTSSSSKNIKKIAA